MSLNIVLGNTPAHKVHSSESGLWLLLPFFRGKSVILERFLVIFWHAFPSPVGHAPTLFSFSISTLCGQSVPFHCFNMIDLHPPPRSVHVSHAARHRFIYWVLPRVHPFW